MAPNEPTWDDTGFDPNSESGGGFLPPNTEGRKRVPAEPPPPPEPSRKKGKGALFWLGIVALGVLAVAVIGGAFYWLSRPSAEETAFFAPEQSAVDSSQSVSSDQVPASALQSELEVIDTTIHHDEEALDLLFGEASGEAPSSTTSTTETKPSSTTKAEPTPTSTTKAAPTTTTTVKATPPAKTTPAPATNQALYVVQVFSSPSRDDADEWLQLLREKNVTDGYVTEQKIKGTSWYRVRFGRFSSRQSAESEAIRLGFKEPWIARVK